MAFSAYHIIHASDNDQCKLKDKRPATEVTLNKNIPIPP